MSDTRVVRHRAEDVARWRAAGLWRDRTLADELHAIAERVPSATAVVSRDGRLSYRELDTVSDAIAVALLEKGLVPGDTVLFQVTNRLGVIPTWYGVLKAGLVPVCTLAPHREHEIGHISRAVMARAHIVDAGGKDDLVDFALRQAHSHPSMRIVLSIGDDPRIDRIDLTSTAVDPTARARVAAIQDAIAEDAVAVMQLSGGTTGVPKLIPRFHAEYWYNARAYAEALGWDETTRVAHLIPIIHNAGITCAVHGAHSVGACLVLGTPDLPASLELLRAEGTTDILIGHGHFLPAGLHLRSLTPTLRGVVLSGAKPADSLFDGLRDAGMWVGQLFGMAEGFFAVTQRGAPEYGRRVSVGTALSPFDEMRILEPGAESVVPDGGVGELCCRGPYTLAGYFDAAEHNARAFTSDGLYRTGDLARVEVIEGERYLTIEGRIKDLINRGGEKINAEEVRDSWLVSLA